MLNKKQHFLRVCKCAAACPPHTIIPVFISLVHQQKKIKQPTFTGGDIYHHRLKTLLGFFLNFPEAKKKSSGNVNKS